MTALLAVLAATSALAAPRPGVPQEIVTLPREATLQSVAAGPAGLAAFATFERAVGANVRIVRHRDADGRWRSFHVTATGSTPIETVRLAALEDGGGVAVWDADDDRVVARFWDAAGVAGPVVTVLDDVRPVRPGDTTSPAWTLDDDGAGTLVVAAPEQDPGSFDPAATWVAATRTPSTGGFAPAAPSAPPAPVADPPLAPSLRARCPCHRPQRLTWAGGVQRLVVATAGGWLIGAPRADGTFGLLATATRDGAAQPVRLPQPGAIGMVRAVPVPGRTSTRFLLVPLTTARVTRRPRLRFGVPVARRDGGLDLPLWCDQDCVVRDEHGVAVTLRGPDGHRRPGRRLEAYDVAYLRLAGANGGALLTATAYR
jgi:hypothetical protein